VINNITLRRACLSRFYKILNAILLIAVFSGSPVFSLESSGLEDDGNKVITGTLVKVDLKNLSIYVKENSRIVKFKASIDICQRFKDKINS
jgi:hypothetical protein